MKNLPIVFTLALILGLIAGHAMAQDFDIEVVSPDPFVTLDYGQTLTVDVYMANCPGAATAGAVELCASSPITMTSLNRYLTDGSEGGLVGPWDPAIGYITPNGEKCTFAYFGNLGDVSPDGEGRMIICRATFRAIGCEDATITADMPVGGGDYWSLVPPWPDDQENDAYIGPDTINFCIMPECCSDEYCTDGLWCTGQLGLCVDYLCYCDYSQGTPPPCVDDDPCTLDVCTEPDPLCGYGGLYCEEIPGTCEYPCNSSGLSGPEDPCCSNPACMDDPKCDVCEGDFDDDGDVKDGDIADFKASMGRGALYRPCAICTGGANDGDFCQTDGECPGGECGPDPLDPCYGDFDCDGDVKDGDISVFKADMGRYPGYRPCPPYSGVSCSYD